MEVKFKYLGVVLVLLMGGALYAQTPVQPGSLAGSSSSSFLGTAAPKNSFFEASRSRIANPENSHDRTVRRIWVGSLFAVAGASAFDAGTSWGRREGNSFLASSDGNFGAKGLSIKAAFAAAVIVPQILLRKHKGLQMKLAAGNFAEAGIFTAVSIHNLHVIASN